jgi:hypothetical protein
VYGEQDIPAAVAQIDNTVHTVQSDAPQVSPVSHNLNTGNRSAGEKLQQAVESERLSVWQLNGQTGRRFLDGTPLPKFPRRSTIGLFERVVESPRTPKAGSNSYVCHRQCRLIDKTFRKMQSLRMRNGQRTCAQMLGEQSSQVATGYAEPVGQSLDIAIIQRSISDQAKTSLHCR